MRWTDVCPLVGAALLSCAIEENDFPLPASLSAAGDGGMGGGSAGTAAGAFTSSGTSNGPAAAGHGGASNGGTFGMSAGASFGGTFATAGMAGQGGMTNGAGSGGKASAGEGGKANGGSGGKANGGAAGAGNAACNGVTVPAKSSWKASALRAAAGDPPARAIDGDPATRFSTGAAQAGDEWLQIDFGASVTLNEVSMLTTNDDYFRHYQLRLSDKSEDFAAAILKEGDGMTGTVNVSLPQTHKGRYLTIRQTGKVTPAWWSLFEVDVDCN